MTPYWRTFVDTNHLVGREVSVPEECVSSGVGAGIEILDESGIQSEQTDLYPGLDICQGLVVQFARDLVEAVEL